MNYCPRLQALPWGCRGVRVQCMGLRFQQGVDAVISPTSPQFPLCFSVLCGMMAPFPHHHPHTPRPPRPQSAPITAARCRQEGACTKLDEDILDIPLDDPDANAAAAKIQASFRGHMTRKKIKGGEMDRKAKDAECANSTRGGDLRNGD